MVPSLHRLMPALLLSVSAIAACSPINTAENKARVDDRAGTPIEPAPAPAPTLLPGSPVPAQTVEKDEASAGRDQ